MTDTATEAPDEAPTRTKAKVLASLRRNAKAIAKIEDQRDALYLERLHLFHEGRGLDDRATQRELAEASAVSETVIINALKKPLDG